MPDRSNRELFDAFAWDRTELGPVSDWPPAMLAVVRTALGSAFPIATGWGEHCIQIYNDAYNEIYGDKHPAAFGAPASRTWGEIWDFLGPAIDGVLERGETLRFASTLLPLRKHEQPEECYFDFSYSPVFDASGDILGFVSVATETTEQIVGRRRLAVLDAIGAARPAAENASSLWLTLHDALSADAQDAEAAVLFRLDRATGRLELPVWSLRADETWAGSVRGALRTAGALPREPQAIRLEDGSPARMASLIPVSGRDDVPVALLALEPGPLVPPFRSHLPFARELSTRLHLALHDIEARVDERQSMRREIEELDLLYRFLFDNMVDAAFYAATDGKPGSDEIVLTVNRQACVLLGYSEQEMIGRRREDFFFDEDPSLERALCERARSNAFVGELTFRHRDGRPVPVEVSSRLVTTQRNETRSVTLIRDASARQARERRHLDEVRTETLSRLSAGIAHDFNNLLTVIVGGTDLLGDRFDSGTLEHEVMSAMQIASEKAASLTRELLSFTRAQGIRARRVDLPVQIREMVQMLRGSLGDAIDLELDLAPGLPRCVVDPTLFTTALLNLVLNARDAMPGGGVVTISAEPETTTPPAEIAPAEIAPAVADDAPLDSASARGAPRAYVRLAVSDTGTGMSAEVLEHIFDPFFTTKGPTRGTGLGLPMVQGFVRQSGGFLRTRSEPGRGTRIELLFPAVEGEAEQADSGVASLRPLPGKTVLVIEDNALVREQTTRMLNEAGFACIAVPDAQRALAVLTATEAHVDVVFTDQMMPGQLSGLQLAREIRRRNPALPILLTTGYDAVDGAGDGAREDSFEILPKPYTRDSLVAALARQLARPNGPDLPGNGSHEGLPDRTQAGDKTT